MSVKVYGAMIVSSKDKKFQGFLLAKDRFVEPITLRTVRQHMHRHLKPSQEIYGRIFIVDRCGREAKWI